MPGKRRGQQSGDPQLGYRSIAGRGRPLLQGSSLVLEGDTRRDGLRQGASFGGGKGGGGLLVRSWEVDREALASTLEVLAVVVRETRASAAAARPATRTAAHNSQQTGIGHEAPQTATPGRILPVVQQRSWSFSPFRCPWIDPGPSAVVLRLAGALQTQQTVPGGSPRRPTSTAHHHIETRSLHRLSVAGSSCGLRCIAVSGCTTVDAPMDEYTADAFVNRDDTTGHGEEARSSRQELTPELSPAQHQRMDSGAGLSLQDRLFSKYSPPPRERWAWSVG